MYFVLAFIASGAPICIFIAVATKQSMVNGLFFIAIGFSISVPLSIRLIGHLRLFFAEDGVHQPRLFGKEIFIAWSSASVRRIGIADLEISGVGEKIRVIVTHFKDPAQLIQMIEERIKRDPPVC